MELSFIRNTNQGGDLMSCKNVKVEECFHELETYINSLPTKKGELISVLHKAQEIFGYLPVEVQEFVSEKLDIAMSEVYGVVTFYSFLQQNLRVNFQFVFAWELPVMSMVERQF